VRKTLVREELDRLVAEMVDRGILFDDARREFERRFIARALTRADGNLGRAAALLGIHRNTLRRKMADYRLRPPRRAS
jgi:DNA-binding NtrC family response regulator